MREPSVLIGAGMGLGTEIVRAVSLSPHLPESKLRAVAQLPPASSVCAFVGKRAKSPLWMVGGRGCSGLSSLHDSGPRNYVLGWGKNGVQFPVLYLLCSEVSWPKLTAGCLSATPGFLPVFRDEVKNPKGLAEPAYCWLFTL